MKTILNIGLIGFGTVGSGVYALLQENKNIIYLRTGIDITIKTICDLNTDNVKKNTEGVTITDRWQDITDDPEIDIVVELIGGIDPAKSIIKSSLERGKNVVTANKMLLAEKSIEILETLKKTGNSIGFEAAAGGGIPCILSLKKGLVANRIKSVTGILNGTTNYILSKMEDYGIAFDEALKDAQEKGFAESDPTFDVEGIDAGHKIAILAMLSFGRSFSFKDLPIEGITKISPIDISYAHDMGYAIRLLGITKMVNGKLDIRVHPTMIPQSHPMASVRNEFNSIMFDTDMADAVVLTGKGAGSKPTASSVISDIVDLASSNGYMGAFTGEAKLMSPNERISRYYIRLLTEDSPGILSKISGILGNYNISIASVMQKEVNEANVPLIIVTHEAVESEMFQCIEEIKKFDFVKDSITIIRVENI
ncbi:MAG: homoserine dehydrogenase [Spirochaetota bacterium]